MSHRERCQNAPRGGDEYSMKMALGSRNDPTRGETWKFNCPSRGSVLAPGAIDTKESPPPVNTQLRVNRFLLGLIGNFFALPPATSESALFLCFKSMF